MITNTSVFAKLYRNSIVRITWWPEAFSFISAKVSHRLWHRVLFRNTIIEFLLKHFKNQVSILSCVCCWQRDSWIQECVFYFRTFFLCELSRLFFYFFIFFFFFFCYLAWTKILSPFFFILYVLHTYSSPRQKLGCSGVIVGGHLHVRVYRRERDGTRAGSIAKVPGI